MSTPALVPHRNVRLEPRIHQGFKRFARTIGGIDELEIAKRYTPHLNDRIIWPILGHLRAEVDLPSLAQRPANSQERELVLMLHSTIVFMAIRKFVYQIKFKMPEVDIIELYVNIWLSGALKTIRSIQ